MKITWMIENSGYPVRGEQGDMGVVEQGERIAAAYAALADDLKPSVVRVNTVGVGAGLYDFLAGKGVPVESYNPVSIHRLSSSII